MYWKPWQPPEVTVTRRWESGGEADEVNVFFRGGLLVICLRRCKDVLVGRSPHMGQGSKDIPLRHVLICRSTYQRRRRLHVGSEGPLWPEELWCWQIAGMSGAQGCRHPLPAFLRVVVESTGW